MGTRDPRVDAYIAKQAEFARPILTHLRTLVHEADPGVSETLKWGHPTFMHDGIVCGMAAFKEHCAFHFWKGSMIVDWSGTPAEKAMGQFGRITRIADLPAKSVLKRYVREAVRLNEQGVKPDRSRRGARKPLPVPDDLARALRRHRAARETFGRLPPGRQRDYIEWITEARRETTRATRLATTLEWLAQGKHRNWKYER